MRAAAIIIAVWIVPATSGCRAMLSTALPASLPIPSPAPMTTKPAPIAPPRLIHAPPWVGSAPMAEVHITANKPHVELSGTFCFVLAGLCVFVFFGAVYWGGD